MRPRALEGHCFSSKSLSGFRKGIQRREVLVKMKEKIIHLPNVGSGINQEGNSLTFYKKQTETSKNRFYKLLRPVIIELVARPENDQRGFRVREKLASNAIYNHTNGKGGKLTLPDSLMVLPSTSQIRGLHTFIRNRETPRDEFIFYSR